MRLYLINPSNPLISILKVKENRWNRFRVWKPLSLMVLTGLIPSEWKITIVDENLGKPDYPAMPRPDLVGITAFTSQVWKYYTLTFPVARYKHLSLDGIIDEMISCDRDFFSMPRILRRVWGNLWQRRKTRFARFIEQFSQRPV